MSRRTRRSRSGLALILVLTVIMALAVIATPFVLSMIMQEKTAVADRSRRQAGYGAEGVRNFAISQLYRGAEPIERLELEKGKDGTPYLDNPAEFNVEIRDARLKDLKIRDPKGSLWGVAAHDEQGKINVTSAPERISVNLRTNLSHRVIDLKDILTIYSGRPAKWVRPQKIRELGMITHPANPTGGRISGARVDNAMQMALGVRLRASKPGLPAFETKVSRNGIHLIGIHAVETDPPIPSTYLHGILEIEMRHPVNINSARRETLTAVFDGLAIAIPIGGTGFKKYVFSPEDSRKAADGLYRKDITTWDRFLTEARGLDLPDEMAKAAVIINAIDPGNVLLTDGNEGRGTVPFCFSSQETITIEALAAVNSEAGTPQGGAGFREVVDLGCPGWLTRSWENQHDFDRMMGPPRLIIAAGGVIPVLPTELQSVLNMSGVLGGSYAGYPFGSRMETFPKDLDKAEASDMTLKAQQGKTGLNFISMRTERDYRGQAGIFRYVDHFDEELDGKKIDTVAHTIVHSKVVTAQPLRPDTSAGGTEFWVKFEQAPSLGQIVKLFDIRETDESNRISVEAHLNEIIFRITDTTTEAVYPIGKGWSEIRAPFMPEKDTWYHIAAYWKGTKYGQMILLVDGFVPDKAKWKHIDCKTGQNMFTELSSQMSPPADPTSPFTPVPLKDTSFTTKPEWLPREEVWTVPLQIGNEVVEFDPQAGQGRRGARIADIVYGSTFQDHPQNAKVTVFGYTSPLQRWNMGLLYNPPSFNPPGELVLQFGPIHTTEGKVAVRFGIPEATAVIGEQTDPDGNRVVLAGEVRIPFVIQDTSPATNDDWPDTGFIVVAHPQMPEVEAIFYEKIEREGPKRGYFDLCQRGVEGTLPLNLLDGAGVYLWGIAVDKLDKRIPTPSLIQVGQEWFGPVKNAETSVTSPHSFWTGCLVNGKPVPMQRGVSWLTTAAVHEADDPIVPVFACREIDKQIRRTNLGRNDAVTVVNGDHYKESHMVCHAITIEELARIRYIMDPGSEEPPPPPRDIENQGVQLASLYRQVKQDFPVDGLYNRVVKWPSGELLDQRWLALQNPVASYGPAKAAIDELKNLASLKGSFMLDRMAPAGTPQLRLTNPTGLAGNQAISGIAVVGEEVIGYARYDADGELHRCKRAWLNSLDEIHNQGDPVFLLNFLPVAAIGNQPIASDARIFPLSQRLAGTDYSRGYILVNDEVIGFEETGLQGDELDSMARFDGTGLFRGMFGTTTRMHPPHSMAYGLPFRYWDGYKAGEFDNRMPYFQVAHTTRDARWREMRYHIEVGQNDPNLVPHAYVRMDGLGDFTIPTLGEHSSVWHFFKAQTNPLQDYVSSRLENGQFEVRLFLEYKAGSFWPAPSWKRTMKVHELRVDYDRDSKVLFHEDK